MSAPTSISCPGCSQKLKFPAGFAGGKARCPGCGKVVAVRFKSAAETSPPPAPAPRPKVVKAEAADEPLAIRAEDRPLPIRPQDEPCPVAEEDADESSSDEELDRPRKRKRRRRRRSEREEAAMQRSGPWWIALGGVAGLYLAIGLALALKGFGDDVLGFTLYMAVTVPLSIGILILSMFISSSLAGGIDFGEVQVVIPKALILLLVINPVYLLPLGGYLALPIWVVGLICVFHLDLWESRFLVSINWILNLIFKITVAAALMAAIRHGVLREKPDDDAPPVQQQQQPAMEQMEGD